MYNPDVEKYINFLKKKGNTDLSDPKEFIRNFNIIALSRLDKIDAFDDLVPLKKNKLKEFINNLLILFRQIINNFKTDIAIKNNLKNNLRLSTIAELSVCIDILQNITNYDKSFKSIINDLKYKILNDTNSNKKRKLSSSSSSNSSSKEKDDEIYNTKIDYEEIDDDEIDDDEIDDEIDEDDDEIDDDEIDDDEIDDENILNYLYNNNGNLENEIKYYYNNLSSRKKRKYIDDIQEVLNYYNDNHTPLIFKILELPLNLNSKNHILKCYKTLLNSIHPDNKLSQWFDSLMNIPFGKYKGIELSNINNTENIKYFLNNLNKLMNDAIYGHDEAKHQIVQIMGQNIRNPNSKGNIIGIWGPKGNGKTSLIQEGIAKAMDKPFIFISLGGATDASFLEGHSYTYEGSIYGRIVNGLISAKCMNPIIYFDELDKISKTYKGDEITNLLIHLTDPIQNHHFRDKYFHGIDIDLSKVTMIFSYNDPSNVNPILLDRITTIQTKYLLISQKIHIANNYLIPNILKDIGLDLDNIYIEDDLIKYIIETYTCEGGVRKLKSLLYNIIREINLKNLTDNLDFPYNINLDDIKLFLKNKNELSLEKIHNENKIGMINGLYAMSDGSHGGIIPIQVLWMPSSKPLEIKATGNLQKVIKESTDVATTLAFNYLNETNQIELLQSLKENCMGLHIHCPSGGVPKDGPSAGTALTVAIYSILTNKKIQHDIAITGEITLDGKVTEIGGLDNKLEGAKKAGVKLVLFPKDNIKDYNKIVEKNPSLFDHTFAAIPIETIDDAINITLF